METRVESVDNYVLMALTLQEYCYIENEDSEELDTRLIGSICFCVII